MNGLNLDVHALCVLRRAKKQTHLRYRAGARTPRFVVISPLVQHRYWLEAGRPSRHMENPKMCVQCVEEGGSPTLQATEAQQQYMPWIMQ